MPGITWGVIWEQATTQNRKLRTYRSSLKKDKR